MPESRNKYTDSTREQALAAGCDIVQLKYDGWFCKAICLPDRTEFYSETSRLFATSGPTLPGAILVGEYMRGTQWSQDPSRKGLMFIFDCWALHDVPFVSETYKDRMTELRTALYAAPYLGLPGIYRTVQNYHISHAAIVWESFVATGGYEGVVYRRSTGQIDDTLYREKNLLTFDGQVIGMEEGEGKHAGRLGYLRVIINSNGRLVETRVGNGFTDAQRIDIFDSKNYYVGKYCEFCANAQFESGNVRHGRFLRWREDKQ